MYFLKLLDFSSIFFFYKKVLILFIYYTIIIWTLSLSSDQAERNGTHPLHLFLTVPEDREVDLQNVSTGLNNLEDTVSLLNLVLPDKLNRILIGAEIYNKNKSN